MKRNTKTKQQLLLEMDELRTRLDTTEWRLKEAKEVLQAKIAEHKSAEEALEKTQQYAQSIVETIRGPLVVLTADLRVISANHSFYQTFKVTPEETEGRFIYSIGKRQWDIPVLRELLEEIIPKNTHFNGFKVDHEFPAIGRRTVLLNARRVYREGKGTEMILLAIEDISERTQWEEALKISETRYRRLFETAQDGILILDADTGQISDVNPFLIEMLGYSNGDFFGKNLWEIGPFRDIEASKAAFLELQNKGYVRYEDLPLKSRDGRLIDVEFVSNVYLVNHKKVIQCNIRDITERKQAEEKLKQAAAEWEVTFDSIKDLISIHDKDFKIVKANKAFVDTLGLESGEVIGKQCYEVFHGTEGPWPNCPHKQSMGSKTPVTEEFWEPRLGIYLEVSSSPILNERNEVLGTVHIAKDITERKRAEKALEVANRFLQIINKQMGMTPLLKEFLGEIRNLTGCSAVAVRLLDDAGNIPYQAYEGFGQEFYQKESPLSIKSDQCMCINVIKGEIDPALPFYTAGGSFYINATSRFLATVSEKEKGKTRNECNRIGFESVALVPIPIGDGIHGLIHVADPRENMVPLEMVELLERVSMQLGTGIHRVRAEEALLKAHHGLEIRVQERTAELAKSNQALQFENEERKQAEEAFRKSEMKYRIVADNTYDWEWWRDLKGNFIYVSPSCKRVTHHEAEEFIKDPDLLLKIIHPDDKISFISHQNEIEKEIFPAEVEFRILRPDGSFRWLAHACQPVFDEQGRFLGRRGSNRNITERKIAEEALRESEKRLRLLSSQLLSVQESERKRIARELHDGIGQMLTAIKFKVEDSFIKEGKSKNKKREKGLKDVIPMIQESIQEVRRIQMDLRPSILDDLGILATIGWFIREFQKIYSHFSVEKQISVEENEIPDSLKTTLFRVMQEAMNNIAKHSKADLVRLSLGKTVDKIELSIEDNGEGFDPKNIKQGLGLTSMRERMELSGGMFAVESTVGKGTIIRASWTTQIDKETRVSGDQGIRRSGN